MCLNFQVKSKDSSKAQYRKFQSKKIDGKNDNLSIMEYLRRLQLLIFAILLQRNSQRTFGKKIREYLHSKQ